MLQLIPNLQQQQHRGEMTNLQEEREKKKEERKKLSHIAISKNSR